MKIKYYGSCDRSFRLIIETHRITRPADIIKGMAGRGVDWYISGETPTGVLGRHNNTAVDVRALAPTYKDTHPLPTLKALETVVLFRGQNRVAEQPVDLKALTLEQRLTLYQRASGQSMGKGERVMLYSRLAAEVGGTFLLRLPKIGDIAKGVILLPFSTDGPYDFTKVDDRNIPQGIW